MADENAPIKVSQGTVRKAVDSLASENILVHYKHICQLLYGCRF